jgi:hypothetical protein
MLGRAYQSILTDQSVSSRTYWADNVRLQPLLCWRAYVRRRTINRNLDPVPATLTPAAAEITREPHRNSQRLMSDERASGRRTYIGSDEGEARTRCGCDTSARANDAPAASASPRT